MNMSTPASEADCQLSPELITELLQTQEWLKNQLLEHQTELSAAQDDTPHLPEDPETIIDSMGKLQKGLQEASTELMLKELLTKRVQQASTMLRYLFPAPDDGSGDTTDTSSEQKERRRILTDLVSKQTALVSEILKTNKENQEVSKEIDALQKDNLGLKQSLRELMDEIQKSKATKDVSRKDDALNTDIQRAEEELTKITEQTQLVRHIFQGLVLGSGVNWAQDPELCKLTLELGQNVNDVI